MAANISTPTLYDLDKDYVYLNVVEENGTL